MNQTVLVRFSYILKKYMAYVISKTPSKIKTDILKVERMNRNTHIMQILTKRNYCGSYIKIRQCSYYSERNY